MSIASDFVIEDGVLKQYTGPGGEVVIPAGVTAIGDLAFSNCESVTSVIVPEGVTEICSEAFAGCENLKSVSLPKTLTRIAGSLIFGAFLGCENLRSVYIGDLGSWCDTVFGCSSANPLYYGADLNVNGELLSTLVVPEDPGIVRSFAFNGCGSLKSVIIPEEVGAVGNGVFSGCKNLSEVFILSEELSMGYCVFSDCPSLASFRVSPALTKLGDDPFGATLPDGLAGQPEFFQHALTDAQYRAYFLSRMKWEALGPARQAEAFLARPGLRGDMKKWTSEKAAESMGRSLLSVWSTDASLRQCNGLGEFLRLFCSALPRELFLELYQTLKASKNGKRAVTQLEKDEVFSAIVRPDDRDGKSPAEQIVLSQMEEHGISALELGKALYKSTGLGRSDLPELKDREGQTLSPLVLSWLVMIDDPGFNTWTLWPKLRRPGPPEQSAAILEQLDPAALQKAVHTLFQIAAENRPSLFRPVCRYADETTLQILVREADAFMPTDPAAFAEACAYSPAACAPALCQRFGTLETYALVRSLHADDVRDMLILPGLGLDDNGEKVYDLGGKTARVRLEPDMRFCIFDDTAGKTVKSIPKRNADPEKYEAAKADLAYLKATVKDLVKRKTKALFQAFLDGTAMAARDWESLYPSSPVMRSLARLLVWEQEGRCFTLAGKDPVSADGQPFTLTDAPVRVAHPMEMASDEVRIWQKYFASRGLKQPFEQIWEPVIDPSSVRKDRFSGCPIPYYRFRDQEKHGIRVYAYSPLSGESIQIDDCNTTIERLHGLSVRPRADDHFEVVNFAFPHFSRRVNHIVAYLDRATVWDRVRRDDVTITEIMDRFTLAQITEFIKAAQEAQAVGVLTLLLEYKSRHFADFDPMDEFTLE